MPELPEVETVRRGLDACLTGKTIADIRLLVPKMLKGTVVDVAVLKERLLGNRIDAIRRRGKYLIFDLNSGYHLLFHLKMRGHMRVVPRHTPDGKYLALGITVGADQDNEEETSSQSEPLEMRFHDIWTWGEVRLLDGRELLSHPSLMAMGVEPLSDAFSGESLRLSLSRRPKTAVKAALLDQEVLAGVGNIYADESLFRSGIRPQRPASTLTADETDALCRSIKEVLSIAVESGGTVSDNFYDTTGSPGKYVPQVYDRGGKPCPRCGTVLERTRIGGRGTVYCTSCQN